jgi:hypothetical protein
MTEPKSDAARAALEVLSHFDRLVDLDPQARDEGLRVLAGEDPFAAHEVAALLAAYDDAGDFLDRPALERLGIFLTVCEAIDAAHRSLIVHRDLKPSNVLLTESGDAGGAGVAGRARRRPLAVASGEGRGGSRTDRGDQGQPDRRLPENHDPRATDPDVREEGRARTTDAVARIERLGRGWLPEVARARGALAGRS